ncbi:MAG: hypothetical protein ACI9ZH_002426, partial [Paracoccaceae bacterium]
VDDVSVQGGLPFFSLESSRCSCGNPLCPHGLGLAGPICRLGKRKSQHSWVDVSSVKPRQEPDHKRRLGAADESLPVLSQIVGSPEPEIGPPYRSRPWQDAACCGGLGLSRWDVLEGLGRWRSLSRSTHREARFTASWLCQRRTLASTRPVELTKVVSSLSPTLPSEGCSLRPLAVSIWTGVDRRDRCDGAGPRPLPDAAEPQPAPGHRDRPRHGPIC